MKQFIILITMVFAVQGFSCNEQMAKEIVSRHISEDIGPLWDAEKTEYFLNTLLVATSSFDKPMFKDKKSALSILMYSINVKFSTRTELNTFMGYVFLDLKSCTVAQRDLNIKGNLKGKIPSGFLSLGL